MNFFLFPSPFSFSLLTFYFPLLAIIFRAALTNIGQTMNFDSRVNAEWADGEEKFLLVWLSNFFFSFLHRTLYFEAGWTVALEKYENVKCLKAFREVMRLAAPRTSARERYFSCLEWLQFHGAFFTHHEYTQIIQLNVIHRSQA